MHEGKLAEYTGVAHTHSTKGCKNQGWMCLRYKYQLKERLTLLHEVAHLIANTDEKTPDHGKKWRETVVDIGGTCGAYFGFTAHFKYLGYGPRGKLLHEVIVSPKEFERLRKKNPRIQCCTTA